VRHQVVGKQRQLIEVGEMTESAACKGECQIRAGDL
jgi:hypothetical protein